MSKRIVAAAVAAVALAVPAAAVAGNGHGKGKGQEKAAAKQQRPKKAVMFVFKGLYEGNGVVAVEKGNKHVKRAGFVGTDVTFDMASAKVVAAEFDNVAGITAADLQVGDAVLVQARLPRGTKVEEGAAEGAAPAAIKARKVVDKTHPPVDDDAEAEAAPAS